MNKTKTISVKLSDNTIEKMDKYFEDKKKAKTPDYALFQAKEADTTVTVYKSGKALFQGVSADIDANIWIETEKMLNPNKGVSYKVAGSKEKVSYKKNIHSCNSIGSDEVGTGDYFGPIVVAAAYVTKKDIPFLEDLGVRDSKKMTDSYITKIVPQIIKRIPYSCMVLSNKDYNEKHSADKNMNAMKAILHNKVLLSLSKKYKDVDCVVVDQFTSPSSFYKYIEDAVEVQKNITFVTKAEDKYLSVACASLISRYVFLSEFDKISQSVGMVLPKGAGEKVDEVGAKIAKTHGIDYLKEIAKFNFKNTGKIKDLIK